MSPARNKPTDRFTRINIITTTHPKVADLVGEHAGERRHNDGDDGRDGRHDRCLLHVDAQFAHVDRQVRVQNKQS